MNVSSRALRCALLLLVGTASGASAQRIFDWTVRTSATAEALEPGASAVFWNPAAVGLMTGRGEGIVLRLEGSGVGLDGIAAAGAARLNRGTAVALGYQHLGVDDVERTTTSPMPEGDDALSVSEDRFTLAAAQPVSDHVWAGALVEYARANVGEVEDGVGFGGGVALRIPSGLAPELGGSAFVMEGETRWNAGAEATLPGTGSLPVVLRGSYGISGVSSGVSSPVHRLVLAAGWRDMVRIGAGVLAQPDGSSTAWQPTGNAELHLGRYLLGVVSESLANDFGSAYSFHFSVRF